MYNNQDIIYNEYNKKVLIDNAIILLYNKYKIKIIKNISSQSYHDEYLIIINNISYHIMEDVFLEVILNKNIIEWFELFLNFNQPQYLKNIKRLEKIKSLSE